MLDNLSTGLSFFRQFLHSPRRIGSVWPSGKFLSGALADMALDNQGSYGLVVDLGAGSGVVSRQLLRHGVPPERILAVDISDHFHEIFRRHCPGVELHVGDARYLAKIIARHLPPQPLQAVISSLPLRNMPRAEIAEIMLEIRNILRKKGGVLIQYTYTLWSCSFLESFGFVATARKYSLFNIPPALIEKYIL